MTAITTTSTVTNKWSESPSPCFKYYQHTDSNLKTPKYCSTWLHTTHQICFDWLWLCNPTQYFCFQLGHASLLSCTLFFVLQAWLLVNSLSNKSLLPVISVCARLLLVATVSDLYKKVPLCLRNLWSLELLWIFEAATLSKGSSDTKEVDIFRSQGASKPKCVLSWHR